MGILDDAIREHLDLKRRLGAEENEIQRLEGEAFGPATRPGDPDFPEDKSADQVQVAEPPTGEAAAAAAGTATEPASEQLTVEPPPTGEQPATAAQAAPPSDETRSVQGFHDHAEGELDLELDAEDEIRLDDSVEGEALAEAAPREAEAEVREPEGPGTDEQPAVEPEPPSEEAPVESPDTVEHHFEGAVEDTGEGEVVEGEIADEPEGVGDEDEDDVLEETPEFLRDQPEDDELWFEQGEPKDFDF